MIPAAERVILVGLEHEGVSRWDLQDSLEELRLLADTAGAKVVETVIQRLDKPTAPFYIGKGKAEEIAKSSREKQATSVIFDDELSPAQSRNLEEITHRKVIDRSQLILDIFAARARTREGRLRHNWPFISLVGYTNAGKSSLLNRLTGATVEARDRLFETLDPTTRQLTLPNHQKVLLTDTVGFIRKLPHTLIESFKATLEEVQLANLLLHVVDLSHPRHAEQIEAVDAVLGELDAKGKQTIMVFNKCDLVTDPEIVQANLARHPGCVAVSARTGEGMAQLIEELEIRLAAWRMQGRFEIPLTEQALLAEIHRVGHVLDLKYGEATAMITAHIPPELIGRLSKYDAGSPQT